MDQLQRLWVYANYCVDSDIQAAVCRPFWTWVAVACFVLAIIIAALIARTVFGYWWEYRKNRIRLAARAEVASPEMIAQAKWHGEDAVDDSESEDEIAAKIRNALNELKAKNSQPGAPNTA